MSHVNVMSLNGSATSSNLCRQLVYLALPWCKQFNFKKVKLSKRRKIGKPVMWNLFVFFFDKNWKRRVEFYLLIHLLRISLGTRTASCQCPQFNFSRSFSFGRVITTLQSCLKTRLSCNKFTLEITKLTPPLYLTEMIFIVRLWIAMWRFLESLDTETSMVKKK